MRDSFGNLLIGSSAAFEPAALALERARSELKLAPESPLRVLIAVSGGEDSVVLLDILDALARSGRLPLTLAVAHFDHRLRPESADEAQFVLQLAERLGYPCCSGQADIETRRGNVEAWAREVRYKFLEQARVETGSHVIATAHHRLDQAETFLFRTITGRLASGAQGIRPFDPGRRLIRPLIEVDKSSIEEHALRGRLSFVFDSSNADLSRTRNRIRHQVIPQLSRMNPNLISAITATSGRLAEDERYLERAAQEAFNNAGGQISSSWISDLAPALQWRVLRLAAIAELGEAGNQIGYEGLQRVVSALKRPGQRHLVIEAGRGVSCRIDRRGRAEFFQTEPQTVGAESRNQAAGGKNGEGAGDAFSDELDEDISDDRAEPKQESLTLPGDLLLELDDRSRAKITARIYNVHEVDVSQFLTNLRENEGSCLDQAYAIFDYSIVQKSELVVRRRLAGDRVAVWGRGTRKVKKLFQEQQVKLTLRDCLPIVCCNGIVLWIPGVARSQFAPVTENTTLILQLIYSRILSI